MENAIRVNVQLTIEVDAKAWAEAYGLQYETVGQKGSALREDIEEHIKANVYHGAEVALSRMLVGKSVQVS